ncbi:MAG UNVERIFIED_CONTAM: hypothetical protein LVR18_31910 [Planctomycetaceae bacterium]
MAVASGLGAVGGVLGAPATGGTSVAVTVFAWTGFLSSAAQCAWGIARLTEIHSNPNDDSLRRTDADPAVRRATNVVDLIGILSGAAAVGTQGLRFYSVLQRNNRRLSESALQSMSRTRRAAVITEEIAELQKTEAGRRTLAEALREAGANDQRSGADHASGPESRRYDPRRFCNSIRNQRTSCSSASDCDQRCNHWNQCQRNAICD